MTNADDAPTPLSEASLWSLFWFGWTKPLLDLGQIRPLNSSDLSPVDKADQSRFAKEHIEELWEQEKKACAKSKCNPSLARAMAKDYFWSTWQSRILITINGMVRIGQAVFLGILLDRLEDLQGHEAYIWASAIIFCGLVAFPTKQHSFFMLYRKGNQYRAGLIATIYAKTLRLPSIRNDGTTCGRVTNLASNDVERFAPTAIYANLLLASPVEIVTVLVVGIWTLGPCFIFAYLLLIVVLVPLQFWLSRRFVHLRHHVAHLTDMRVTLVSQAITGARVLKLQGWELELEKKILLLRNLEIKQLQRTNRLKACNDAIYYVSSLVVLVSVLALNVGGLGETLSPRTVFTTFTLLNLLQYSVTKHIPNAIMGLSECYVACQRIQKFLELSEQQIEQSLIMPEDEKKEGENSEQPCMEISDGTICYWDGAETNFTSTIALKSSIPLEFHPGKLYCVIGKVGSGKSALLQALIGELTSSSGGVHRDKSKSISYAQQDPWIMDGTAQENITMGLPFDADWYNRVVQACSLESDFDVFPQGDQTIVGDRGVQCSGGQKARLALARAIYCDSDILILDDPLSAVDAKVARTIYHVAIQELGVQRGKCVILATHQLQFAGAKDNACILMDEGTVLCYGLFTECVSKSGVDLSEALQSDVTHDEGTAIKSSSEANTEFKPKQSSTDNSFVEKRQTGRITKRTWHSYVESLGGSIVFAVFLLIFSLTQAMFLATITYIGKWAEAPEQDTSRWYGIVFGLTAGTFIFATVRAQLSFHLFLRASQKLHNTMLGSVLCATVEFYDTNPQGRILNRFTSDVGIVDEQLPFAIYEFGVGFIMFGGSIVTACIILPLILVVFPLLFLSFARLREIFVKTTRELKRLEGLGKSPIYAMLSESIAGISTIRANNKHKYFANKFESIHNQLIKAQFAFMAVSRWFAIKLDLLSFIFLTTATLSAVIIHDQGWFNVDPAVLGVALSLLLQLAGSNFPFMVRQSAEVTNLMVSVERLHEFGRLIPLEAPLITNFDKDQEDWPKEPSVAFENVCARYRDNLPLCLKDVSFSIKPGERVGVVGRTGAGKTSLLQVLFRVLEAEKGSVTIGGVDVSKLGLHKLRTNMAVITQSPVLFSGCTIRENLDPYPTHSGKEEDKRLESALRAVHMWDAIESIPNGLDGVVSEGGSNFSVGQRQLLCLARALLADSRIVVLDEATANVDQVTDTCLQETLRERFDTATIIAIAHRLDTIIDYDKVLVLGNGRVLEFGAPADLLEVPDGHFALMVASTGQSMAEILRLKAKKD